MQLFIQLGVSPDVQTSGNSKSKNHYFLFF